MNYRIALQESDEGYAVWVPALPGCCSQGTTRDEAIANITTAIREYLEVVDEQFDDDEVQAVEIAV
jgi:predicted RNase H-like HicB family nuclease